jgi:hypothetical protein
MPRQMGSAFIRGETRDENGALRILFFAEEVHRPHAESILSPLLQSNFINSASPRVFCAGYEFYAQAFSPSSTQADLLAEIKQLTQRGLDWRNNSSLFLSVLKCFLLFISL